MMKFESCFCSSLAKVLPGSNPENPIRNGTALKGERFSFQLAYRARGERSMMSIEAESELKKYLRIRKVGLVPVTYTGFNFDKDIISSEPGIYPDILSEFTENENYVSLLSSWRSIWITVDIPKDCVPGKYKIQLKLKKMWIFPPYMKPVTLANKTFTLEVLNAKVPAQTLKNTHWFHSDCLAVYYNTPVFSEEHWRIIGNFMKNAAAHGQNMILTPVFTPPLDTLPGGERPTVQLVKIYSNNGKYRFDFSLLERWIQLAWNCGMKFFEISHLFTQWGACATPKIIAEVDGTEKRIFGWNVPASSKDYADFLDAFLPALTHFLEQHNLKDKVYFHCSDEPSAAHLENYRTAKKLLGKHLKDFKIMDALSDIDFYKKEGLVQYPVPYEKEAEIFYQEALPERWIYYACLPDTIYSNRFIHMPSSRNRIFGYLLYYYRIEGFLHWGFNFYFSGYSVKPIDPYKVNDAGNFFPAGDGFLVYPGSKGIPEDSIRHEVFFEALQDQRILMKLESMIGRDAVLKILDEASPRNKMKMSQYPRGEKKVLALRRKINKLIAEHIEK